MPVPGGRHHSEPIRCCSDHLLSAFLDHELPADLRALVSAHLDACQTCAGTLDGFRLIRQLLGSRSTATGMGDTTAALEPPAWALPRRGLRTLPLPLSRIARPTLDRRYRRQLRRLLNQQCWCWGQDIRRPAGNLLIEYGVCRSRAAASASGRCSRYMGTEPGESRIWLWGFGLIYSRAGVGAIYLDRYDADMAFSRDADAGAEVYQHADVAGFAPPATPGEHDDWCVLFAAVAAWIARYERWVVRREGIGYRASVLAGWRELAAPAGTVATEWLRLSSAIAGTSGLSRRPGSGAARAAR